MVRFPEIFLESFMAASIASAPLLTKNNLPIEGGQIFLSANKSRARAGE
jgi:hypothetical protein